jgi:heat shock protein HtpX
MRQMQTMSVASKVSDWDVPITTLSGRERGYVALLVAVPTLACGGVGYAAFGPAGALLAVLPAVVAAVAFRATARRVLLSAQAVPIGATDEPRLTNIAVGLARDLGMRVPRLYVVSHSGPNAVIAVAAGEPAVGLSPSALTVLNRTELEAVVAHCLIRLNGTGLRRSLAAALLGTLARPFTPVLTAGDDARAAALTRYPPALASAIQKAAPRSGRYGSLWFVSGQPWHASPRDRVMALEDL